MTNPVAQGFQGAAKTRELFSILCKRPPERLQLDHLPVPVRFRCVPVSVPPVAHAQVLVSRLEHQNLRRLALEMAAPGELGSPAWKVVTPVLVRHGFNDL